MAGHSGNSLISSLPSIRSLFPDSIVEFHVTAPFLDRFECSPNDVALQSRFWRSPWNFPLLANILHPLNKATEEWSIIAIFD